MCRLQLLRTHWPIAELADGITAQRSPEVLDTLAAAYAANAEFERAQQTMRKALELVGEDHAYSAGFRQRLSLYARGEVFVQPPAPGWLRSDKSGYL